MADAQDMQGADEVPERQQSEPPEAPLEECNASTYPQATPIWGVWDMGKRLGGRLVHVSTGTLWFTSTLGLQGAIHTYIAYNTRQ